MNGTMRLSVVIDGQTREATVAVNQVTDAMRRLEGQARQTGPQSASAIRQTGEAAADAARLSTQQLSNMQFQLQDIAVSLASGQSPFTVMMQQGSQMAQSFQSGTGVMAALRSVGQGIAQFLTNPLNLAVLGFATVAGAAGQFFAGLGQQTEQANVMLDRHREFIDEIGAAYKRAQSSAENYAKSINPQTLLEAQLRQPNLTEALDIARSGLAGRIGDLVQSRTSVGDQLMLQSEGGLDAFNRIVGILTASATGLETGAASVEDIVKQIQDISTSAPESAIGLRRFVLELIGGRDELGQQIDGLLKPLSDTERAVRQNEAVMKLLQGSATGADRALLGLDQQAKKSADSVNGLSRALGNIPATIGGYGPRSPFAGAPSPFEGRSFLDLLGAAEGTDRGRGYNETLGYGKFTGGPVDLVTMTLNQVMELQRRMLADPANTFNSSAVGRYQITRQTLMDFMPRLGLTGDTVFTPEVQDKIALAIANAAGRSVERLQGRWEGLKFVAPGTILGAFDGAGGDRAGIAAEEQRLEVAKETKAVKEQEAEVAKLIAEATRRIAKEEADYNRNTLQMLREQNAFIDQFRGLTDGLVSGIARAREAGASWTDALGAGLDMVKNKALSVLDSFIDKALDMALFGQRGGGGGGLLGGILSAFFGGMGNPMQNALGNAFTAPVMAFDKGGIGNWPTLFPMRGGMGKAFEAGPEAIMPLARGPSGHLGVRAQGGGAAVFNMNVVNQVGADVSSRATPNGSGGLDIEMLIERKIDQQLARPETVRNLSQSLGTRPPVRQWGEY